MKNGFSGIFILIGILIVATAVSGGYYFYNQNKIKNIDSFEECANAGYPVMEIYPEKCRTQDGRIFTKELSNEEKKKLQPPQATTSADTNLPRGTGETAKIDSISPNRLFRIYYMLDGEDILTSRRLLILSDTSGGNKTILLSRLFDVDAWMDIADVNWNQDNKYVFMQVRIPDGGDMYIFRTDGKKFSNNKLYLLASEIGYNNMPIKQIYWTTNSQLEFIGGVSLVIAPKQYEKYILDVEKEIVNRIGSTPI